MSFQINEALYRQGLEELVGLVFVGWSAKACAGLLLVLALYLMIRRQLVLLGTVCFLAMVMVVYGATLWNLLG